MSEISLAETRARMIPLRRLTSRRDAAAAATRRLLEAVKSGIERQGLYPPLIVRAAGCDGCFQIVDGHVRRDALEQLGHSRARCEVWPLDDEQAELMAFSLNHLRARRDTSARARTLRAMKRRYGPRRLAAMLAMTPAGLDRSLRTAGRSSPSRAGQALQLHPVFFHLTGDQLVSLTAALKAFGAASCGRAEALGRLVQAAVACPSVPKGVD